MFLFASTLSPLLDMSVTQNVLFHSFAHRDKQISDVLSSRVISK